MIYSFNKYIELLNEGLLKTTDGELCVGKSHIFLNPLNIIYNINYNKMENSIQLEIINFNKINTLSDIFGCIESYFINMNGWYPSIMVIEDLSGMKNTLSYDKNYLLDRSKYFTNIKIKFESKFDLECNIPEKLYHLSIRQFMNNIKSSGLYPKTKSKLTIHPDRVYLCSSIENCESLIGQMKMFYSSKKWGSSNIKIDDSWIIYEIDTTNLNKKLYKDPNYINGYYMMDNIEQNRIKVIKSEKPL